MAEQDITMYLQQSHDRLFENNRCWAEAKAKSNPSFFKDLAAGQAPEYLWIGCADSRIPAEQICGLEPGEAFIHRNIANLVCNTDLNAMGVINYAVKHLGVKHIIVCGHYGCGGVKAAMTPKDLGLLNPWLRNIRDVYRLHEKELDAIEDESARYDRLVELNVVEQCRNVIKSADVQQSYSQNKYPIVHGWVFGFKDGLLKDLKIDFEDHGLATPDPAAVWAFKVRAGDASGGGACVSRRRCQADLTGNLLPEAKRLAALLSCLLELYCSSTLGLLCAVEGENRAKEGGHVIPLQGHTPHIVRFPHGGPRSMAGRLAYLALWGWDRLLASDAIANAPDLGDASQLLVGLAHIRPERRTSHVPFRYSPEPGDYESSRQLLFTSLIDWQTSQADPGSALNRIPHSPTLINDLNRLLLLLATSASAFASAAIDTHTQSFAQSLPSLAIASSSSPSAAKMSESQLNEAPTAGTLSPLTDADPTLASPGDEVRPTRAESRAVLNILNFIAVKLQHLVDRTDKICDLVTETLSLSSSISSSDASTEAKEDTALSVSSGTGKTNPNELKSEELFQKSVGDHGSSMATAGEIEKAADMEQEAGSTESIKFVDGDADSLASVAALRQVACAASCQGSDTSADTTSASADRRAARGQLSGTS
ncbi:carbonic anhydrase [Fusarium albosuccineum]|uniref:Carbonic anhydrase n=1 Tax=Fusarium albosuccineum TaxID=1237068 RepID=A0A8H4L0F6_9HYPO|nr:carbonic anhydrase [Fusarium albosuccineum]